MGWKEARWQRLTNTHMKKQLPRATLSQSGKTHVAHRARVQFDAMLAGQGPLDQIATVVIDPMGPFICLCNRLRVHKNHNHKHKLIGINLFSSAKEHALPRER